jgi:hypothetical protein
MNANHSGVSKQITGTCMAASPWLGAGLTCCLRPNTGGLLSHAGGDAMGGLHSIGDSAAPSCCIGCGVSAGPASGVALCGEAGAAALGPLRAGCGVHIGAAPHGSDACWAAASMLFWNRPVPCAS